MVTAACNAPADIGPKWPWIVQFAPAARLVPQLLAKTNDEAFVPVTAMLLIGNAAPLVFVIVTVCELLIAPTEVDGNVRLVADSVNGSATPVPCNATL